MNFPGHPTNKPMKPATRHYSRGEQIIPQTENNLLPEEPSYADIRKELDSVITEILEMKRSMATKSKRRKRQK